MNINLEKKIKMKLKSFQTPLKSTNFMFCNCSSLTSLNLSNFKTNNITNMSKIFYFCSSLTSLNLSNFKINTVNNKNNMLIGLNKNCNIICNDKNIKKIQF